MPTKLTTTIAKISTLPNKVNAEILTAYLEHMRQHDASERHQNNQLKAAIAYARFLGSQKSFLDVGSKEEILAFLDMKIKPQDVDPEKKWITTWNDSLQRIKRLFRWIHSQYQKQEELQESDWETPVFARIKQKKTKRLSPYSETDIWDRDELLFVLKYARNLRDKAALSLFWDLDGRNHEITTLKIKDIRLRQNYGEGAIPETAKTGSGPILLTCSFPYVRDWLKVHPDKDNSNAPLICSLKDGSPLQPEAMWGLFYLRLKPRLRKLLESGEISDPDEREKLEHILKTRRFNPYCLRHSAITYDGDSLPEFALRRKVRWSMNSKQPARYMKRRMGNNLKRQILVREGLEIDEELKETPAVNICPKCTYVNARENKACSNCDWPFSPKVQGQIQAERINEMESLRQQLRQAQEVQDRKLARIVDLIRQNPILANIKAEVLDSLEVKETPVRMQQQE